MAPKSDDLLAKLTLILSTSLVLNYTNERHDYSGSERDDFFTYPIWPRRPTPHSSLSAEARPRIGLAALNLICKKSQHDS